MIFNYFKQEILKSFKLIFTIVILTINTSCNAPKYTYLFESGKYLDFRKGKWLLNKSYSNSKIFDAELYEQSKNEFKQILGDSLFEINDLRLNKLIPSKINFNLNKRELNRLSYLTNCDYLINITGNIISNGADAISISNQPNDYGSNKASVEISIYDLKSGILLSSSQVNINVVNYSSPFEENKLQLPRFTTSSHTAMVKGAKKLIKKYSKNSSKN